MYENHVVAFFSSFAEADKAKALLLKDNIADGAMRLSADQTNASGNGPKRDEHRGFFDWLFGSDAPEQKTDWYSSNLKDGRTALSVGVNSDSEMDRVEAILDQAGALEVDLADEGGGADHAAEPSPRGSPTTEEETVIPVVNEELTVGKRALENTRRVRTHMVERPVEGQVQLQEETVTIERRPVAGDKPVTAADMQGRDFEVIERHEEPVVEKRARAVEEVVVKKDVRDRTETVRDSVKETKVEAEGESVPRSR